jgi:hypothetical protein
MEQVIIFQQVNLSFLQDEINNWIAANHGVYKILDIKFDSHSKSNSSYYAAMIIYEKKG